MIDISWPLTSSMTTYKDKKDVTIGATTFTISPHTGTHVDAPAHFITNGNTIEDLTLEKLIGPCRVLDLTHVNEKITRDDLAHHEISSGERILIKTKNSFVDAEQPFVYEFVYLEVSAAQLLAERDVVCVGIDYLGIERAQENHETHKTLLEKEMYIIEGLRLSHVEPGLYTLYCLPLLMPGLDGAPARAVLI